jgi:hypothetical protein
MSSIRNLTFPAYFQSPLTGSNRRPGIHRVVVQEQMAETTLAVWRFDEPRCRMLFAQRAATESARSLSCFAETFSSRAANARGDGSNATTRLVRPATGVWGRLYRSGVTDRRRPTGVRPASDGARPDALARRPIALGEPAFASFPRAAPTCTTRHPTRTSARGRTREGDE